jgi:hypothetical protein
MSDKIFGLYHSTPDSALYTVRVATVDKNFWDKNHTLPHNSSETLEHTRGEYRLPLFGFSHEDYVRMFNVCCKQRGISERSPLDTPTQTIRELLTPYNMKKALESMGLIYSQELSNFMQQAVNTARELLGLEKEQKFQAPELTPEVSRVLREEGPWAAFGEQ